MVINNFNIRIVILSTDFTKNYYVEKMNPILIVSAIINKLEQFLENIHINYRNKNTKIVKKILIALTIFPFVYFLFFRNFNKKVIKLI